MYCSHGRSGVSRTHHWRKPRLVLNFRVFFLLNWLPHKVRDPSLPQILVIAGRREIYTFSKSISAKWTKQNQPDISISTAIIRTLFHYPSWLHKYLSIPPWVFISIFKTYKNEAWIHMPYKSRGWIHMSYKSGGWINMAYKSGVWIHMASKSGGWIHMAYKSGGWIHMSYKSRDCIHMAYKFGGWIHMAYMSGGWIHMAYKMGDCLGTPVTVNDLLKSEICFGLWSLPVTGKCLLIILKQT